MTRVGAVDEGKRRELQRMRRPRLMSLIASLVYPGDEDFLRRIDAMYSTAKDSMEDDEANDEDDFMGDLVDELVLGDMNADDKQDFRMVSDAVQECRIRRVQQTWQSIKKNVAAKIKAKAKAKAKAKGKGKGKGKGRVRKFLRPRMLPKKRPGAPDEGRVPGPEADDQNVGMDGGVPRPEAADQNLEGRVPGPGADDLDVDMMEGRVPGPHRPEHLQCLPTHPESGLLYPVAHNKVSGSRGVTGEGFGDLFNAHTVPKSLAR